MSLAPEQKIISADDHMDLYVLPRDLWESRLPAGLRERGPRVVETDDDGEWWEAEGRRFTPYGRKASGLLQAEGFGFLPYPTTDQDDLLEGPRPGDYGMAFVLSDYVRRRWLDLFELVALHEAPQGWQDYVVLRRR